MAKYHTMKFESGSSEVLVYWESKHRHDAAMNSSIAAWLKGNQSGNKTWSPRINSYQSNQNKPTRGVEYKP
jgi:hypothetical protein